MNAIEVSHVTKRFPLATNRSIKQSIIDHVRGRKPETFTALDDVDFVVRQGETLGIIGPNGAGKSTLLSIIAGTISPTEGSVRTHGTVSSLLELGAGFHPDLSGRENVMLYGAIMGIPRETMRQRFDDIVEFSGLEKFIDQPVRFYSSGMYVRLGFAVAVQVDPDILLVDEVLAVGDADFQRKCLARMHAFRDAGKSLLLISHDLHTICSIADRLLLLDHGRMSGIGDPMILSTEYQSRTLASAANPARRKEWGTSEIELSNPVLVDADGAPAQGPDASDTLRVRIHYQARHPIDTPTFGFAVCDGSGLVVYGSNTTLDDADPQAVSGGGDLTITVQLGPLQPGDYLLSFSVHSRDHRVNYHRLENALKFHFGDRRRKDGVVNLQSSWQF